MKKKPNVWLTSSEYQEKYFILKPSEVISTEKYS